MLGLASYLVLNAYLFWKRGQTVDKAIMGIAIVSARSGDRLPLWRLLGIRALFFPMLYVLVWPPTAAVPLGRLGVTESGQKVLLGLFL